LSFKRRTDHEQNCYRFTAGVGVGARIISFQFLFTGPILHLSGQQQLLSWPDFNSFPPASPQIGNSRPCSTLAGIICAWARTRDAFRVCVQAAAGARSPWTGSVLAQARALLWTVCTRTWRGDRVQFAHCHEDTSCSV